jgi:ribose/xylose/arabinose/galactoside ABC-type transport system permease subunit
MRFPCVRLTVRRTLFAALILSLAAGFVLPWVTIGFTYSPALVTLGFASPFLALLIIINIVISTNWQFSRKGSGLTEASPSQRRPRLTILQMMLAMGVVSVMCWCAVTIAPIWWGVVHQPTYAELAEGMRRNAARWERLAAENPALAKEYRRLAERSNRAASRLNRTAKAVSQ